MSSRLFLSCACFLSKNYLSLCFVRDGFCHCMHYKFISFIFGSQRKRRHFCLLTKKKNFPCFIFDLCVYSGKEKINRSIFVQKGIGDKTKEKHEIPFRQRKAIFVLLLFSFFILIIIRLHIFLCFFVQGYVTTIFLINLYLRFLTFKKI